jgi:putative flippase GtrA
VLVTGRLSVTVNFGLVTVLKDFDPTLAKAAAVAVAAVAAAFVAWRLATRYAIGAIVSWPVYSALYIAMLKVFDRCYAFASAISWMLSDAIVYAFQKYGTFGAMHPRCAVASAR